MENRSICLRCGTAEDVKKLFTENNGACGHSTMIQAVDSAPKDADTLVVDYFPDLLEHIELLTRIPDLKLKRIIFRKASRTHGYFLSSNAHARLDTFDAINVQVYWYDELTKDLYLHVYKKEHGFFVREEMGRKFQEATILAFYGSAVGLDKADTDRISGLVEKLSAFIGPNLGVLTGGGGGVMRLATDQARSKGALTGACFLELEAQPPELGVDFFNTFQEVSRHFRQKWFEVADFCIFNVGGVGTLEEIGIELCNLKLGIRPRVPYVFFNSKYWADLRKQVREMIRTGRAPRGWPTTSSSRTTPPRSWRSTGRSSRSFEAGRPPPLRPRRRLRRPRARPRPRARRVARPPAGHLRPGQRRDRRRRALLPGQGGRCRGLVELARREKAAFVVVGPEVPLTLGLADRLAEAGIPVYGPRRRRGPPRGLEDLHEVHPPEVRHPDRRRGDLQRGRARARPPSVRQDPRRRQGGRPRRRQGRRRRHDARRGRGGRDRDDRAGEVRRAAARCSSRNASRARRPPSWSSSRAGTTSILPTSPRTTSGSATATRGPTPAAWAPTRPPRS
jgi:predicted Rossmann-fold nucleotide-binding protein